MNIKFQIKDIVRLKEPNKQLDVLSRNMNLFRIIAINDDNITLCSHLGFTFEAKHSDILPVPINGEDDKNIYYDPVVAAAIVYPGDEIPTHRTDYTYYMEQFKWSTYNGKTFFDMIKERELKYVHEVQHFLVNEFQRDELKF